MHDMQSAHLVVRYCKPYALYRTKYAQWLERATNELPHNLPQQLQKLMLDPTFSPEDAEELFPVNRRRMQELLRKQKIKQVSQQSYMRPSDAASLPDCLLQYCWQCMCVCVSCVSSDCAHTGLSLCQRNGCSKQLSSRTCLGCNGIALAHWQSL